MTDQINSKVAKDIQFKPSREGMIDERVVNSKVAPESSYSYLENFHADTLGELTSRRPYFNSGYNPASSVVASTLFLTPSSSPSVVWQEGGSIKYSDITSITSGNPTVSSISSFSLGTYTKQNDTSFENTQGVLLVANQNGSVRYTDVSSGTSTAISFGFPTASGSAPNLIASGFDGRVWGANTDDPELKVYYSDTIPSAGITSTTGSGLYLRVNASNNDKLSGLLKTQETLFVFTFNSIFRIFNAYSIDNAPFANVGAVNQSSIVTAKDGTYFFHTSGVYQMSGGYPKNISLPIKPIIERIKNSDYANIVGWSDDDHVYFSIGSSVSDLTPTTDASGSKTLVPDRGFIIRYCISTQTWSINSTINNTITSAAYGAYNPKTTYPFYEDLYPSTVLGFKDLAGYNFKLGFDMYQYTLADSKIGGDFATPSGNNVNSADIPIILDSITPWRDFDSEMYTKDMTGFAIASTKGAGLKVFFQTDRMGSEEWKPLGELTDKFITIKRNTKVPDFNRIKFRVTGESRGDKKTIGQVIPLIVTNKGYGTS